MPHKAPTDATADARRTFPTAATSITIDLSAEQVREVDEYLKARSAFLADVAAPGAIAELARKASVVASFVTMQLTAKALSESLVAEFGAERVMAAVAALAADAGIELTKVGVQS